MRGAHPLVEWLALLAACLLAFVAAGGAHAQAPSALPTVSGKVSQWQLPTIAMARDPVADADGKVYYAVAGADKIGCFDAKSGQFKEWQLPAGTKPHAVAVARDGRVLFAGNGDGTIGELDPATGKLRRFASSSADLRPYSSAFDQAGNLWLTARKGRILRLDRASAAITEYAMDGDPYGILVDGRGGVWVTRIGVDAVSSLNPATGKTRDLAFPAGAKPRRLAMGADGMLWVSLYGAGKVVKVDPALYRVVKEYPLPGGSIAGPYAVDVDARGRVWAIEFQTDSIVVLEPGAEKFRVIRLPGSGWGARNGRVGPDGRFWLIGSTNGMLGLVE